MLRNSYNIPNHAHYLTFSCYRRQHLLTDDRIRRTLLEHWDKARSRERFKILAYVIMSNHVHLLVLPNDEDYKMSQILRRLKEPFSRWVVKHWVECESQYLKQIEVTNGSKKVRRFWQVGGGYDRNIHSAVALRKAIEYIEWNPVRAGLVTEPSQWRWSSAFVRKSIDDAILSVDETDLVEVDFRE